MSPIALLLLTIGFADWIGTLSEWIKRIFPVSPPQTPPTRPDRSALLTVTIISSVSAMVGVVAAANSGYQATARDLVFTFMALTWAACSWKAPSLSKAADEPQNLWKPQLQLLLLGASIIPTLLLPLFVNSPDGGRLAAWASKIGSGKNGKELLAIFGIGVFLTSSSNTVVRLLLTSNGIKSDQTAPKFRGGRIIGTLERLFIFALALAGEPTAAALVISAKGLLRYSSTQANSSASVLDEQSEYLVVGSLASWGQALLAVLLVGT